MIKEIQNQKLNSPQTTEESWENMFNLTEQEINNAQEATRLIKQAHNNPFADADAAFKEMESDDAKKRAEALKEAEKAELDRKTRIVQWMDPVYDKAGNVTKFMVKEWDALSAELIKDLNLFQYQGVYTAKINGVMKTIDESPMVIIERHIAKLELNLNPATVTQIAKAVVQRVEEINVQLKDTTIYFKNGDFDIISGKFTAKDNTKQYNHRMLPHDFVKPAGQPLALFNDFMSQYVKGDSDLAKQMIEVIGAVMVPTWVTRKAFFLVGTGGQGKSGFMDYVRRVIGQEKISDLPLSSIASNRAFDKLPLVNKMGNFIDDLEKVSSRENSIFKSIVAGGTINAEVKGGKSFSFKNEATIFANGNDIPQLNDRGSSTAITDRMVIIELKNKIAKDLNKLNRVMQDDVAAIGAYLGAVAMHKVWHKGLTETAASKETLRQFELDQDSVARWLDEVPDFFNKGTVLVEDAYQQYSIHIGRYAVDKVPFGKALLKHRPDIIKSRKMVQGVRKAVYIAKGEK